MYIGGVFVRVRTYYVQVRKGARVHRQTNNNNDNNCRVAWRKTITCARGKKTHITNVTQ